MSKNHARQLLAAASRIRSRDAASALEDLCAAGVACARAQLARRARIGQHAQLARRAHRNLERYLHVRLADVTAPAATVYLQARQLATSALRLSSKQRESRIVATPVAQTMQELFRAFPALEHVWVMLVRDWVAATAEFLRRLDRDRPEIERTLNGGKKLGLVTDVRAGLSDPHRGGRAVIELRFGALRIFYKPRSGRGEDAWFDTLRWLNELGFQPRFRCLAAFSRPTHCWQEAAISRPCQNIAAAERFYRRLGAMLYLATRFRAVDCHRGNLIAAGEHPMLVDAETLFHQPRLQAGASGLQAILDTGFVPLPDDQPGAEYRSSPLCGEPGPHQPKLRGGRLLVADFRSEIERGYADLEAFVSGSITRVRAFEQKLEPLKSLQWRWLPRATVAYSRYAETSMQPKSLRSPRTRLMQIARLCRSTQVARSIRRAEIVALYRLDVPYFTRRPKLGRAARSSALEVRLVCAHPILVGIGL